MRLAEFKSLIRDAETGRLSKQDWQYVNLVPLLWELRCGLGDQELLIRGYFHEPPHRSDQTVVLLFHEKDISLPSEKAIAVSQNAFIVKARDRLLKGEESQWGLDWSHRLLGGERPRA
jgi:hypothetical protein